MTLTHSAIAAMPVGGALKDAQVPGLQVRRTATGHSFMLYYRTRAGVQRRPKLGEYPALSVAQAREIARGLLARVAAGNDPVDQWERERAEPTVADLWKRVEMAHYNRDRSWDVQAKRLYELYVASAMGTKKVRAVQYEDVAAVHLTVTLDAATQANRVLAVMSTMFKMAERWRYRDPGSNPCRHVDRNPERKRKRYAAAREIAAIGPILDGLAAEPENLAGCVVLYLLIYSGARPSEILRGKPNQVQPADDGSGVLVLREHKTADETGEERRVHLPPQAMALLARLPADREYLAGRCTMPHKLWHKVRTEAGCPDLWARDWRRTFATTALSNGAALGAVADIMGHRSIQTTKAVYALLTEDAAKSAAVSTANTIERIMKG